MTLLSHLHMPPTEGRVRFADYRMARFLHITWLVYIRSHLWLGALTERQGLYKFRIFPLAANNWSHCTFQGYRGAPRYEHEVGSSNSCSELYNKARASVPEIDISKATSGSRHSKDSRKPFSRTFTALRFETSFLGIEKPPFLDVGRGTCRSTAKLGRKERRGGGKRFFQTPAEVDSGRRSVHDRKGLFLGID